MTNDIKSCVLTAHNNQGWYPRGQKRLISSLNLHGNKHDVLALSIEPFQGGWRVEGSINSVPITPVNYPQYKSDCVYTLKAAAFQYALDQGYELMLWLDCSVWAIKDIEPVFDIVAEQGHYFWRSGYSLGQTCSTACLNYFKIDREEAFDIHDSSTSMFGLYIANEKSLEFLSRWLKAAKEHQFHGSRDAIEGREGREQLFEHRQDQSVASALIHLMNLTYHEPLDISSYANESGNYPDSVRLVMRGL